MFHQLKGQMKMNKNTAKRGFTLVELLLVIAIIAILASLGVGVMAQAQEDAAVAATRSRMTMIQKILEIELEDYEVRRSPVPFASIGGLINASTLDNPGFVAGVDPGDKILLHAKNLKRMIIADLIRAEMPDGSRADDDGRISQFPSDTLLDYLGQIGVPRVTAVSAFPIVPTSYDTTTGNFDSSLPSVQGWAAWPAYDTRAAGDLSRFDEVDVEAADKSELLYQILLNIDIDGVPAVDQLGTAIADTDGDTFPEIIDAWGDPIFLQWQQEWPILAPGTGMVTAINQNIWQEATGMGGLSKEHITLIGPPNLSNGLYCKPVLPTQIRPFLVSERLIAIDGTPTDYQPGVDY